MEYIDKIKIRAINDGDIGTVQDFLMGHLKELFNSDGHATLTDDVWGLSDKYVKPSRNQMWAAFDEDDSLIGTIAISQYNGRIKILEERYNLLETAEIGRCYINRDMRRKGIGKKLLDIAENFCRDSGYNIIYLHTHHFLPGGYNFWQKNDFAVVLDEGGSDEIIHMEKHII